MQAPPAKPDPLLILFSYYRDAELRGSNLIYRMLRMLRDGESQLLLCEHLADETRHAWLWSERIKQMGAAPLPIDDGYQVRIGKRAGLPRHPVDLLALTVVVEQRALRRYQEHLHRPDVDERTLEVLRAVSKDEGWLRQTLADPEKWNFDDETVKKLLRVNLTDGYGNYSTKVLNKIIPELKKGIHERKALENEGYNVEQNAANRPLKNRISDTKNNELRNPVLEKATMRVARLVNQLIKKHNIDPEKSLFYATKSRRFLDDLDVLDASTDPPQNTRAKGRAALVRKVIEKKGPKVYVFDWSGVAVERNVYFEMPDPFDTYDRSS